MKIELKARIFEYFKHFLKDKFQLWVSIYLISFFAIFVWNLLFLNSSAFKMLSSAIFNTFVISLFAVLVSLLLGIFFAFATEANFRFNSVIRFLVKFILDSINSIPQILLLLSSYVFLIIFFYNNELAQMLWLVFSLSIIYANDFFIEISNRIQYFKKNEFYNASLILGISERKIIIKDILISNSKNHLLNRIILVFSSMIFLFSSVDFIISVGLSTNLSLAELPKTLGNILASLDSKQDILAISMLIKNPLYLSEILTTHLEGITAASILILTLISSYKISNSLIQKMKLY